MDIVTVVNRTSKPVEGIFDGHPTVIAPHAEKPMLANEAEMLKRQNPVMGSEDPGDPRSPVFLVGIKEWNDDCSPLEQTDKVERFDRGLAMDAEARTAKPLNVGGGTRSRSRVALNDDNPVGIETR